MISEKIKNLTVQLRAVMKPGMSPEELEQAHRALNGLFAEVERVESLENPGPRPEAR